MSFERMLPLLRLLIVAAIVGVVVLTAAVIRTVIAGNNGTPRTQAERAVIAAEEAVKINPNDATARVKLAAAYLEQGSTSKAIEQAKVAVRLKPGDPSPYYVLGLAESKSGRRKDAIADLKKASSMSGQLAPFYQDAYVALAHAQEADGDSSAALKSMDAAISYGTQNAPLLADRGAMYERAGKHFDAAVDFAWALQYVPDLQDARAALDEIRQAHPDDYKRAITQVTNAMAGQQPAGSTPATATP